MAKKNEMTHDDELTNPLFTNGTDAWSEHPLIQKHIHKDWSDILKDETLGRELKGLIREAQLKNRENKFIEYKIMFDTKTRKRFFIETAICDTQYGEYKPSGYLTSLAAYWHIEGYNKDNVWQTWVFTRQDITNMIKMEGVEDLTTDVKALRVYSTKPDGDKRIQWTKCYSIPYGVVNEYQCQKIGKDKLINSPAMLKLRGV